MTDHPTLINLAEILSKPVAFLVLIILIDLYTLISVTVEKPKEFSRTPFFRIKRLYLYFIKKVQLEVLISLPGHLQHYRKSHRSKLERFVKKKM